MLSDIHLNRYADVLLWGLKKARTEMFRRNDNIIIRYDHAAVKLAEILQSKILDMGMNPILRAAATPQMDKNFYERANNKQLMFHAPGDKELNNNLNGSI